MIESVSDPARRSASAPSPPPLPEGNTPQRPPDVLAPPPLPDEPVPDTTLPSVPLLPQDTVPYSSPDSVPAVGEQSDSVQAENEQSDSVTTVVENAQADTEDDGWEAIWEPNVEQYYFYNRITLETTWDNPRVPSQQEQAEHIETLAEKLAKDVEFQKLSKSEKIKRYEEEQAKLETQSQDAELLSVDVDAKQHAQLIASTFGDSAHTTRKNQEKHRVTKGEMRQYKKQKKEKKEKKLREWLLD